MDFVEFVRDGSFTFKEVDSPINGKLTVKWDISYGYQILGGGLWQVGGPVRTVWMAALKKARSKKPEVKNVLILGLGGGSIAKLVRDYWEDANIVGVDIDPVIVELGKEYLGLSKVNVDIHINDAAKFIKKNKQKFDLICVDTYIGDQFPEEFESDQFLKSIKQHLEKDGYAIFNRLYFGDKRKMANLFETKLQKVFSSVEVIYPEAAALYLCSGEELG